ncbi:MAG TPA: DUF494 family protein [Melioribacteraceae bacterium]|nr:DUF494 family protein [Melioribacteraceae bacterium]
MKNKIVEVITHILESLSRNIPLEDINHNLSKSKDYDEQTLGIAFSLIYDKMLLNKKHEKKNSSVSKSKRILTEDEKDILGMDNHNYILHLTNLGLMDIENLESILEQIHFYPENKLTRKEINWMILVSLIEIDSEFPSGSRLHLYTSDSVN